MGNSQPPWVNMVVGTVLGGMSLATAPVLVKFYDEPRLLRLTMPFAAGFLINAACQRYLGGCQDTVFFRCGRNRFCIGCPCVLWYGLDFLVEASARERYNGGYIFVHPFVRHATKYA